MALTSAGGGTTGPVFLIANPQIPLDGEEHKPFGGSAIKSRTASSLFRNGPA